jgi:hypothetical protein
VVGDKDIVASEHDRLVRGTHLWYAKLDRGSRSTLVWIDDAESRVLISSNMMLEIKNINRPRYNA